MRCGKCGRELKNNVKFCTGCGSAVPQDTEPNAQSNNESQRRVCPNCHSIISDKAKFCPKCGSTISDNTQSQNESSGGQEDKPVKKRGCSRMVVLIVLAMIAVVAIGGFICYQNNLLPFDFHTQDEESTEDRNPLVQIEDSEEMDDQEKENGEEEADGTDDEEEEQPQTIRTEGYIAITNASASSELNEYGRGRYSATHVYDNNLNTPWCEDADGLGVGEWIQVELGGEYEVTALEFYNGFMESYDLLNKNAQICNATLEFSDGTKQSITVGKSNTLDTPMMVKLSTPVVTSSIKITIDSAYTGEKFEDTCLSELRVIAYDGTAQLPALVHVS